MAGHHGRNNLVLHASNYIVQLGPTTQEDAPVFIVTTSYSDSVKTAQERVLASTSTFRPTTNQGVLPYDLSQA